MDTLRKCTRSFWSLFLAGCVVLTLSAKADAQNTHRGIAIGVESIRIVDEDDDLNNDEPYLIVTKFQFRVRLEAGRLALVPGTLRVENIMSGHNNLGRRDDNWADEGREGRTYSFSPRYAQAMFPWNEDGWVIGAVVTHMEEDGFAASTAARLGDEVRNTVERALLSGSFDAADAHRLSQVVIRKVSRDLSRSVGRFDVGGIIRSLASAADPDDCGGSQIVVAVTAPGNRVFAYSGSPTTDEATLLGRSREIRNGTHPLTLTFPTSDVAGVPHKARFSGNHQVNLSLRIWEQGLLR
ncbi:MAG: hypothetical protein NZM31_05950 [Gemmatales bacterium]|nr:hypothetical protein [Gemmatales bacterium]MDW8386541.1 hypothetical protein [Gemmatales bacterium]